MNKDFKVLRFSQSLLGAASVLGLLSLSQVAYAQDTVETTNSLEATAEEDETKTLDTVVVTGFRKSLTDALVAKRNSGNITDGISAEDIGKSSDQNIAEAMQRITGVAINRQNGEGSTVTVRGIEANLNNVTINGVTLTNAAGDVRNFDAGQAVDFSAFSSDLISQIEVAKTPSADHDEGSLGAAINLTGFKPLNFNKERRVFEIQGRGNDLLSPEGEGLHAFGDAGYRFNASLSEKLFNDRLGLSLVATSETTKGRQDSHLMNRFEDRLVPNAPNAPSAFADRLTGGITNGVTGALDRTLDYTDADGNVVNNRIGVLLPFNVTYDQTFFETKRNNLNGAVQWQPDDTTDIQFDVTLSRTDRKTDQDQFEIRPATQFFPLFLGNDNVYNPETFDVTRFRQEVFPAFFPPPAGEANTPGGARNIGYVRPAITRTDITEDQVVLGLNVEKEWNDFTFNLSGGTSKSTAKDNDWIFATVQLENQPQNINSPLIGEDFNGFHGNNPRSGIIKGYDCEPGGPCQIFVSDTVPNRTATLPPGGVSGANPDLAIVDDPFEWDIGNISARDRGITDLSKNLFFDVDWDRQFGPITKTEFGVKWSERNRKQAQTNQGFNRNADGFGRLFRANITEFVTDESFLRDGFGEGIGLDRDNITDGIVGWDPYALRAALQAESAATGAIPNSRSSLRDITTTAYAAYLKANFEALEGRLFGDVGVRYAKTEVESEGNLSLQMSRLNFLTRAENQQFFGFNGVGDPTNTRTFEEAAEILLSIFGPNVPQNTTGGSEYDIPGDTSFDTYEYDNWLPSLNVNYQLRDDMLLRFALSRTMARPNIDQTRTNLRIQENTFGDTFASSGNTRLNPYISDNFDLSYEWYFDEESLFSIALFNKELSDGVRVTNSPFSLRDFRDIYYGAPVDGVGVPGLVDEVGLPADTDFQGSLGSLLLDATADPLTSGCLPQRILDASLLAPDGFDPATGDPLDLRRCNLVNVVRPVNTSTGYVRGAEVTLQHNLSYLPGIWSGLGFTSNYTYSDSQIDGQSIVSPIGTEQTFLAAPLPNTSLHTFNATVFYEKDGKLLRLAYNTRSDYLISSANVQGGVRLYGEGDDSLDASGSWDITDNLTLNFQAVNLLDTVTRQYAVIEQDLNVDGSVSVIPGEALSLGDQPSHRTALLRNSGRVFRIGLRYEF